LEISGFKSDRVLLVLGAELVREFILFSRIGQTDSNFGSLHDAGRLDIMHECIVSSLFLSHGLRRDVIFHAILNGPPNPPVHIKIDGQTLYDVRTNMETWQSIIKKTLAGKQHPGISKDKVSFEALLKSKAETGNCDIYVLEEGGKDLKEVEFEKENSVFVLGDHVGIPKKTETFALRFGKKISLGKTPYLATSCITVINYTLDQKINP
jgi:tRNA (pseudouridine54-N1)-methyltransferase